MIRYLFAVPARSHLALGFAHCAIRTRDREDAERNLEVAERAATNDPVARCEAAAAHARVAVTTAGDAGLLRQRAIARSLLARVADGEEAIDAAARARALATSIEDLDLLARLNDGRANAASPERDRRPPRRRTP